MSFYYSQRQIISCGAKKLFWVLNNSIIYNLLPSHKKNAQLLFTNGCSRLLYGQITESIVLTEKMKSLRTIYRSRSLGIVSK